MNYLRVLYRSFLRNKKVDELEQKLKDKDQQIEKLMLYQIHCQDDNPEYFPIILTENEQNLLIKYLKRSKIYLEYGSGGSTFLALKESETKIFSVESDANWIKYLSSWKIVKNALEQDSLKFLHADIGPVQVFGYPLNRDNEEVFYKYSSLFFNSYSEIKPDTIFIDGRFRVACALKALQETPDSILLIHDYPEREYYHVISKYYDIIASTDSLYVFKRKETWDQEKLLKDYDEYKNDPR